MPPSEPTTPSCADLDGITLPQAYHDLGKRLAHGSGIDALVAAASSHSAALYKADDITKCVNLANPAAGSTSLYQMMKSVASELAHHLHTNLPSRLYDRGARCFVMPLRDPAARFVTAFKFENAVRWPPTGSARLSHRPGSKHEIGPQAWLDHFRGATYGYPHMPGLTRQQYNMSLPGNQRHAERSRVVLDGPGHAMGVGNLFLAPQATGLPCTCTCTCTRTCACTCT